MNLNSKRSIQPSHTQLTPASVIRMAGAAAMVAGFCYIAVGFFHPVNALAFFTTTRWAIVHALATAMGFFGLLGFAGLYARQVKESGWLGLAGFVLLSLWLVITTGFTFAEVFILPLLAPTAPAFVEGFLGSFSGATGGLNMGLLPTLWSLTGPLYIAGGLLFGIATLRAGLLPRWAAGLLGIGTALAPVAALLPAQYEPMVAVPVGLALAWLGYALVSERREPLTELAPGRANAQLSQTGAD
jgi:hypothetical protein